MKANSNEKSGKKAGRKVNLDKQFTKNFSVAQTFMPTKAK